MRSRGVPTPPQRAQLRPQRTLGSRIAAQFCQRPGDHQACVAGSPGLQPDARNKAICRRSGMRRGCAVAAPLLAQCLAHVALRLERPSRCAARRAYSPLQTAAHAPRAPVRPSLRARQLRQAQATHRPHRDPDTRCAPTPADTTPADRTTSLGRRLAHENALMAALARAANVATATSAGQTRHTARRSPERSAPGRSPIAQSPPWRSPTPGMARGRHVDHGHHP